MSDLDEIRDRMDALEVEVSRLREDAAATRTLAAMADRDASEVKGALRAHTQSLSVLRETQVEQGRTLNTLAEAVGGLVMGQQALAETVGGLVEGQQRHDQALAEITSMLRGLTERD